MSAKKKGFVPRAFKDAGTGERFEGGKSHDFHPGAHANYTAAGLIAEEAAKTEPASASKGAA